MFRLRVHGYGIHGYGILKLKQELGQDYFNVSTKSRNIYLYFYKEFNFFCCRPLSVILWYNPDADSRKSMVITSLLKCDAFKKIVKAFVKNALDKILFQTKTAFPLPSVTSESFHPKCRKRDKILLSNKIRNGIYLDDACGG